MPFPFRNCVTKFLSQNVERLCGILSINEVAYFSIYLFIILFIILFTYYFIFFLFFINWLIIIILCYFLLGVCVGGGGRWGSRGRGMRPGGGTIWSVKVLWNVSAKHNICTLHSNICMFHLPSRIVSASGCNWRTWNKGQFTWTSPGSG